MKTLQIDIDFSTSPENLVTAFRLQNLQKGDKLMLYSSAIKDRNLLLLVAFVVLAYFQKKQIDFADSVLQNIFSNKNIDEIEKEITGQYGVQIEIQSGNELEQEKDFWSRLSMQGIANAYGNDEPEYNLNMIKEPNPDYKGWKKEQ